MGISAVLATQVIDTTSVGRSVMTAADQAAARTAIGAGTSFFDGVFASLTSKPTTVSGYGITNAYTKTEVDNLVAGLLDFEGNQDCSANPNYPSALKGDAYYVSVAGKIGGASGKSVDIGDLIVASADNAGGTEASVGTSWFVLEKNLVGALVASNNLSDLASASTARTNLGLGTLATQSGTFSGTSSGTNTGDQTTISGNAGSATVLQTARTINGVSFDGSANITVTAAGSTLSDTVTVAKGGTGLTALGTALQVLRVNAGATALEYATASGGTPGGSSGQVQYNNAGAFGGMTAVVYAGSGTLLTVTSQAASDVPLLVKGAASQSGNLFEARSSSGTLGARVLSSTQLRDDGGVVDCAIFGGANTLYNSGGSVDLQTLIGSQNTSYGPWTTACGSKNIVKIGASAVGRSVYAPDYSVCIGMVAGATGTSGGVPSGPDYTNCIVINSSGGGMAPSANYQWVVSRITEAFWGRGVTNAAPENVKFNGTGGLGTNIAGSTIRLAPGRSTGNATPASVIIQRTVAGSSGTTAQTLSDAVQVDGNTTAGETPLLLLDIDKGTLQRVSIGASDSGGTGFKVLRVPN